MDELRQKQRQGIKRHSINLKKDCPIGVVSIKDLTWSDHNARIIDCSVIGIGIETEGRMEPGLIWFKERIYGQSCGCLVWCKPEGLKFRSGIQFLSLPRAQEEYVRHQVECKGPGGMLQDPERLIESLFDFIKLRP